MEDALNKIGSYEIELLNISPKKWDDFLKAHSNLPGQNANMELARAFARTGTLMDFKKYIRLGSEEAPANTADEFLTLCGVLGIGHYLAKYHDAGLLKLIAERANDRRARIRQAVVTALKTIGHKKITRLQEYVSEWASGTYLEQRAAIEAFCDPDFLRETEVNLFALELLDWCTATIVENDDDHQDEGYRTLQQSLSHCWGIAVSALPEKGKNMMERWLKEDHPIVNSIMRENLKTELLFNMDSNWAEGWLEVIST